MTSALILQTSMPVFEAVYNLCSAVTNSTVSLCGHIIAAGLSVFVHHAIYSNYLVKNNNTLIENILCCASVMSMTASLPADLYRIYLVITHITGQSVTPLAPKDNNNLKYLLGVSGNISKINVGLILIDLLFTRQIHDPYILLLANMYYLLNNVVDLGFICVYMLTCIGGCIYMAILFTLLVFYSVFIHRRYPVLTVYIGGLFDILLASIGVVPGVNGNDRDDQQLPMPNLDNLFRPIPTRPTQVHLDNIVATFRNINVSDTECCAICRHTNRELSGDSDGTDDADETKIDEGDSDETKIDEDDSDETKIDEDDSDETKIDEGDSDETKIDECDADETKIDEDDADETKIDECDADETKIDECDADETKIDEINYMNMRLNDLVEHLDNILDNLPSDTSDSDDTPGDNLSIPESNTDNHTDIPDNNTSWIELPNCNHKFHKFCISGWLTTGNTSCPVCRANIGN